MNSTKLLKKLAALIVFIFLFNFLANKFYWYSSIWYFDAIMHFLGGLWVGLLALYIFRPQALSRRAGLEVLLCVLVVGIGWEVFERVVDTMISKNSVNYFDIISDIFFDLSGGIAALASYMKGLPTANTNHT